MQGGMIALALFLEVLLVALIAACVIGSPALYLIMTIPVRRFPGKAAWVLYRRRKPEFADDDTVAFVRKKLERNERWFRRSTRIMIPLFVVIDTLVTMRIAFRLSAGSVPSAYRPVLVLFVVLIWIDWLVPMTLHAVSYRYRREFRGFLEMAENTADRDGHIRARTP